MTDSASFTTWMWATGQSKEPRISLVFWLGKLSAFNKTENTERTEENLGKKDGFLVNLSYSAVGHLYGRVQKEVKKGQVGE